MKLLGHAVCATLGAIALALAALPAHGQKKKPAGDKPQLLLADPFVVPAGKPSQVKLRGLKLEGITEVRCHEPKSSAKLVGKPVKVAGDAKLLNQVGDMQVEIEVTAAADAAGSDVAVSVVSEAGESQPVRLLVVDHLPPIEEKEPNNGFRQAQAITLPATIAGSIQSPQDVDVFRFDAQAGDRVAFAVLAARYGSPLDPLMTLYDSQGRIVAASNDTVRSENACLTVTLPHTGAYFLSLIDANDQGGPLFRYRLTCRLEK